MPDSPSISLTGKVVIQCGGTGLLGRALVSGIADAGAQVIVASRNRESLSALAESEQQAGRKVTIEQVDITSEDSLKALRDKVIAQYGRIDGLVFNAVSRPMTKYTDDLTAWQSSMQTNATGFFAAARVIGDAMAEKGSGSLVNIASIQGMVGPNFFLYEGTTMGAAPDYFFHKGGMINLTRYLAAHYGPKGVRANVISPGGIYNPAKPQADAFLERYGKMTMIGRMADAQEIVGPVNFFLSDASTYVTGANLAVDGGYTAK